MAWVRHPSRQASDGKEANKLRSLLEKKLMGTFGSSRV